ncbi:uncharacterized protein LOC143910311 isoform X1 [Arctopsyche grandis]|uniref:uncharacterized protein LOC143910311 isoform X1 n=1 Tax=Arctopsyche grandis TaxID=121162 RepID=UPI00406D89C3
MTKLTEEMVVARSKQSDLSNIKRLNCWGAELTDISILKRMANIEVLAFSINKIRSLSEFQHCRRLKELYVRKNRISDLSELRFLRRLPALKVLWLDENPCAEAGNYRMTVLRALPQLEKLDNVVVQAEEVEEATRKGTPIIDSDADDDYEPELENCNQYWSRSEENNSDKNVERDDYRNTDQDSDRNQEAYESSTPVTGQGFTRPSALRRSPPTTNGRNVRDYDRHHEETSAPTSTHAYGRPSALPRSPPTTNGAPTQQTSPIRQRCYSPDNYEDARYEQPTPRAQYFERSASLGDDLSAHHQQPQPVSSRSQEDPAPQTDSLGTNDTVAYRRMLQHSQSANSIKEYSPMNGEHANQTRYQQHNNNRHSVDMTSPQSQHGECYYERGDRYASQNLAHENNQQYYPPNNNNNSRQAPPTQQEQWERDSIVSASKERDGQIASAVMADHKGFTRRPMTRNSNLLSAVLCLVKELDYTSLEVAEMAVRCRMDELANRP